MFLIASGYINPKYQEIPIIVPEITPITNPAVVLLGEVFGKGCVLPNAFPPK
jgi:hypothetical protein